jgi:hypothetical protein
MATGAKKASEWRAGVGDVWHKVNVAAISEPARRKMRVISIFHFPVIW